VVEGVDPGQRRQQAGGTGVAVVGGPGAEILVDGRHPAAQAQARWNQAQRRSAVDRVLVVETDAGQRRLRERRQQGARAEPVPQDAARVDRVRAEVRLVRTVGAARTPADLLVRLDQPDAGSALGAGDGRGQARDPASDDRDLRHRSAPYAAAGLAYSASCESRERAS
jgi:hypothetical protein